ncbi:MAG: alpha/beta fold hydrolase, partial [Cyanobacteria bacterium P01_D01_bin.2]
MSQHPSALWLTVSPALKRFDQRLLCRLSKRLSIARWEYMQTADEPCCLHIAIDLLHGYLQKHCSQTRVHLVGHGLSGVVAWLYAQRYPEHVRSLTLLSVNANPAVNWQAHYYALRQLLPCSSEIVLDKMVRMLFGSCSYDITRILIQILEQDIDTGLALHSLAGA